MWWLRYGRLVLRYVYLDGGTLDTLVGLFYTSGYFLRLGHLVLAALERMVGHFGWVCWKYGLLLEMLLRYLLRKLLVTHAYIAIISDALPPAAIVVWGEGRGLLLRDGPCQILDGLHWSSLAIDVPTYCLRTAKLIVHLDTVREDLVVPRVLLDFGQIIFVTWQSGFTAWHYLTN